MPPKIKTSQEEILAAAFEVTKNYGISAITAKSVSAILGTSVAPIFRVFQSIEELKEATVAKLHDFHVEYLKSYPFERSHFFTYGMAYLQFAKEYPRLFDALMESRFFTPDAVENQVSDLFSFIENSAADVSSLDIKQAQKLFYHVWLYTHGIACLICKGSITLSKEEEKHLLINAFQTFLHNYSEGES